MEIYDVADIIKEYKMTHLKGMSVREAAKALQVSERTIFRMIKDARLVATKLDLPDGKYIWDIDTLSVAKILVRKEVEAEYNKKLKVVKKHRRSHARNT